MSRRFTRAITCTLAVVCSVCAYAQPTVSIRFHSGLVTLKAHNTPLGAILSEWNRVGDSKIVNAERLVGPPLTLELTDVGEREALSVLLRSVSGYVATHRFEQFAGRSVFDRIIVLPAGGAVAKAPVTESFATSADRQLPDPQQLLVQLRYVAGREADQRAATLRDATTGPR